MKLQNRKIDILTVAFARENCLLSSANSVDASSSSLSSEKENFSH